MGFPDINFGLTSAENEVNENKLYLTDGFFDKYGYVDDILNKSQFLVIGPKGSGKSALSLNIELLKDSKNIFVTIDLLQDFYYKKFGQFIPGSEPERKNRSNWEFLLLLRIIDSLKQEKSCRCEGEYKFDKVIGWLEQEGISGNNLSDIMKKVDKKEFQAGIKKFLQFTWSSEKHMKPKDITDFLEYIKKFVMDIRCDSYHYLFIDGLDDVRVRGKLKTKYFDVLAALIVSAQRLNFEFKKNGVNAKIIVLCRSDFFNKIYDPNMNKSVQDLSVLLDWYSGDPDFSNLIELANLRAQLSLGRDVDFVEEFFPRELRDKKGIKRGLLEFTRHRPRDFIQLLNYIQKSAPKEGQLNKKEIWNGINDYSRSYFQKEIKDELVNFIEIDQIPLVMALLRAMERTIFHLNEAETIQRNDDRFAELKLTEIFNALYKCGAVGNFNKKFKRYSWEYQNPDSELTNDDYIAVHKGLHYALNLKNRRFDITNKRNY